MEDSIPYRKQTHFRNPGLRGSPNPIRRGKSCLQILLKALFFVVFIMLLPLFPSQAPDFMNDTILDKLWELIHLLFIGIAVSYGLFSRRNVDMGVENNEPNVENLESFMPRMFDGCENLCGSDEKRVVGSWNAQNFVGGSVNVSSKGTVFNGQCKPMLSNYGAGFENSWGYGDKNVAQAWNSQYFQGESMVFLAQPNYAFDEFVKPKSVVDEGPLGLPIRSLKSKVKNQENAEFVRRNESGFGSKASSNGFDRSRNRTFGDLAPINLLEKFNQAMDSPSPTLLRSSTPKMERGKSGGGATRPAHFRPLSVDEAQFESLKARSFRSTLSFSSQTSSTSSSTEKDYSSVDSEVNSEMVHLGKRKKSSRESPPPAYPSQPTLMSVKPSMISLHSRGYSAGSSCEENLRRSSENYFEHELNGTGVTGCKANASDSNKKLLGTMFFRAHTKPASLSKASSGGKSVRTIRSSTRLTTQDKVQTNEKTFDFSEALFMRKERMQKEGLDKLCDMPKPTFSKYQKEQEQDLFGNMDVRSEEISESEAENFEASSEDEDEDEAVAASSNTVNVAAGTDCEVDKKAGEFIAKFREQIRLQKVASIDRSRGLSVRESCFRYVK